MQSNVPLPHVANTGLKKYGFVWNWGMHLKIASLGENIIDQIWKFSESGRYCENPWTKHFERRANRRLLQDSMDEIQFLLQFFPSFEFKQTEQDCAHNFFHGYKFKPATRTVKFLIQNLQSPTLIYASRLRFALAHPLHTEDPASTFYMITMLHPRIVEKWKMSDQKKGSCWSK